MRKHRKEANYSRNNMDIIISFTLCCCQFYYLGILKNKYHGENNKSVISRTEGPNRLDRNCNVPWANISRLPDLQDFRACSEMQPIHTLGFLDMPKSADNISIWDDMSAGLIFLFASVFKNIKYRHWVSTMRNAFKHSLIPQVPITNPHSKHKWRLQLMNWSRVISVLPAPQHVRNDSLYKIYIWLFSFQFIP